MNAMAPLTLRELRRSELTTAAQLLGRSMCNNPANVRVFCLPDAEQRRRALIRFFGPVLSGLYQRGLVLGAFQISALVGVCGMGRPGYCQPTPIEKLRVTPSVLLGNRLGTALRVLKWAGEWARRDPNEPHWHLGPVAVDPALKGSGIGTAMLAWFCALMDNLSAVAYLETDKPENVRFYQKFGFTVVAKCEVLGVSNWFMSRPVRTGATLPLFQTCASYSSLNHSFATLP
jgi:ribosomal protein S18 acetylase RimI-like enzyme